jgi:ATP-binding cassette subfamily B protein
LHVTNGTIPSGMASRLQTPSVIKWKESFALILKSSQEGILLASPNEGLINISSDNFKNNFEDEINVLLLEKTKETPQKIFNLNWFWPAIQKYKVVLIQVLIASFVVQLFTLGNPLLIQVIIDKVISQRSLSIITWISNGLPRVNN